MSAKFPFLYARGFVISTRMIRWLALVLGVIVFSAWAQSAFAQGYPLANGEVVSGEPIHFNAQGVVFKRPDGTFTGRTAWTNFTVAALKQLGTNAKAKPFVDQFLDAEDDEPEKAAAAQQLRTTPVPRLERPNLKSGIGALFSSPLSIVLVLLLYGANIYSAYEISVFRNYPRVLACGIAAVTPIIGPIIFLCLPTYVPAAEEAVEEYAVEHYAVQPHQAPAVEHAPHGAGREGVAPAPAAPAGPPHTVYKRGQTTFNRRFFETKLSNFLRVIPSDADKDMVLWVKSSRGEHTGTRIARVMPNELFLHVEKGGASQDIMIPFTEIAEVHVKHKDA
ncbi:MAG: hypothetical protein L0Y58_25015 [Verrucomicrobia subdivision 3 bacterium]|nr:hypothetical protein [Limisphaerales bacterium]